MSDDRSAMRPPLLHDRKAVRVAVDAFAKISGDDGEFVFRTRDLSESGLFLYTKVAHTYPFRVGSTLQLEIYDYDELIACDVVVVRIVRAASSDASRYTAGFGVRIARIAEVDRERLRQMIARASQGYT